MKQKYYKDYLANMIPCIGYGLLTGLFTGATIFFFKFLAGKSETLSRTVYTWAKGSVLTVALVFAVLLVLAYVMSRIHKAAPECKGGGIPRSEGILRGILPFAPLRTFLGTFFGSMLSFLAGLPCGSEGPAVLIGTSLGHFAGKSSKKRLALERYVMTGGAGAGFAVALFDGSILLFRKFTSRGKKGPVPVKLMVTFVLAGILCFFLADGAYSGHHMIEHVLEHSPAFGLLLTLFAIRLAMMLLVTDSGATGGIFIPTLAIGVLAAAIITKLLIFLGMPAELSSLMIFLGMCAFIGGTLRAPLTASVLFVELSGQFTGLFYVAVVVFVVSLITEVFGQTPFYDKALEEMTESYHHGKQMKISRFTLIVSPGDFVVGKSVRDIMWPHTSVIESISHAESDILEEMDDGEQRLYAGDRVTIRAAYYDKEEILKLLLGLAGDDVEIEDIVV